MMHVVYRFASVKWRHMSGLWFGLGLDTLMTPPETTNGIVLPHAADDVCLVRQEKKWIRV